MVQRRAKVIQCFLKNGETGDDPYAHDAVLCSGQDAQKGLFFEKQNVTFANGRKGNRLFLERRRQITPCVHVSPGPGRPGLLFTPEELYPQQALREQCLPRQCLTCSYICERFSCLPWCSGVQR